MEPRKCSRRYHELRQCSRRYHESRQRAVNCFGNINQKQSLGGVSEYITMPEVILTQKDVSENIMTLYFRRGVNEVKEKQKYQDNSQASIINRNIILIFFQSKKNFMEYNFLYKLICCIYYFQSKGFLYS